MSEATWDEEVWLISHEGYSKDSIGQSIPIEKEEKVCCYKKPISRGEFYQAGQNDIEIAEILVVHPYEYNYQKTLKFNGQQLSVIKTYQTDMEEIELTCVKK